MIEYLLTHPDDTVTDITEYVSRGLSEVSELAFDVEGNLTIPSDFSLIVDDSQGFFSPTEGIFNSEEITQFLILVKVDGILIFTGAIEDYPSSPGIVTLKVRSLLQKIVEVAIYDFSMTGTPAAIVKALTVGPSAKVFLPANLVDVLALDSLDAAQGDRGLSLKVDIPLSGDDETFSDLVTEIYRLSGMYIFTTKGVLSVAEFAGNSGFGAEAYDYDFSDQVIAGSIKIKRPVLWQKTKIIEPYDTGGGVGFISKTIADADPDNGPTILATFQEKILKVEGLGGKIIHATAASIDEATQNLLGWRGEPRYMVQFDASMIDAVNRGVIQSMPVFAKARVVTPEAIFLGIVTQKKVSDDKAGLQLHTISEPVFLHPYLREWPELLQTAGGIQAYNWADSELTLNYFTNDDDTVQTVLIQPNFNTLIPLKVFYLQIGTSTRLGIIFSNYKKIDRGSLPIVETLLLEDGDDFLLEDGEELVL